MKFRNFWLLKAKEKSILKVVEWAQRNRIKVEELTYKDIKRAMQTLKC